MSRLHSGLLAVVLGVAAMAPGAAGAPAADHNVRGVHTLITGSGAEMDAHLAWARLLTGPGGSVTQPFGDIGPDTAGASEDARAFTAQAYDRGLTPIIVLQGHFSNQTGCDPAPQGWARPIPDDPADESAGYRAEAEGYRRFVADLPRVDGLPLYVQVGNEPNLHYDWGGAANPEEYARFFVDVAAAIRALGDPRIRILPAALSPEGDIDNLHFLERALAAQPSFAASFDAWNSHSYPHNQPPERNLHDRTALPGSRYTIDAYLLELEVLRRAGIDTSSLEVIITETGYDLTDAWYPEYPAVTEENRAEYMRRAFGEFWPTWPEVRAVTPFQLADPHGSFVRQDWVWPSSETTETGAPTRPRLQYAALIPGTGVVRGRVTDRLGHPLKDVEILLGDHGRAESAEDGSFALIAEPGAYTLRAEKTDYASAEAVELRVSAGEIAARDIMLEARFPPALRNGSFELGDLTHWTTWGQVDDVETGPWYEEIMPRHQGHFLGTAANCGAKNGGVHQSVATEPGSRVTVTGWVLAGRQGDFPVAGRLGIDPTAGTDPQSAEIVWSPWSEPDGRWHRMTVTATAGGEAATVFLEHLQDRANIWNFTAFDGLEVAAQTSTSPSPR
jgi:Carboxypeptidase regulatory-like domain